MIVPRVGVGVILMKENQVLLGKRKNSHGKGNWAFPRGKLDYKESLEQCAQRELMEETGLDVTKVRFGSLINDIFDKENLHYITLFMLANYRTGEPKAMEPHKCKEWKWFYWNDLPRPLFIPVQNLLKQGYDPFK